MPNSAKVATLIILIAVCAVFLFAAFSLAR